MSRWRCAACGEVDDGDETRACAACGAEIEYGNRCSECNWFVSTTAKCPDCGEELVGAAKGGAA